MATAAAAAGEEFAADASQEWVPVLQLRFPNGVACPHCESDRAIRWSRSANGLQRYRCKNCRKTFSALTHTPFSGLHGRHIWPLFCAGVRCGWSLRRMADNLNISLSTAFRWRHRLLDAIRAAQFKTRRLFGVIEINEIKFLRSFKGQRFLPRPPRRRAPVYFSAEEWRDRVWAVIALSRSGPTAAIVIDSNPPGPPRPADLHDALGPLLETRCTICAPRPFPYRQFCKTGGHIFVNASRSGANVRSVGPEGSIYHGRNAFQFRRRLREWLRRFRGIATKYLRNYLAWYVLLDQITDASPLSDTVRQIFAAALS